MSKSTRWITVHHHDSRQALRAISGMVERGGRVEATVPLDSSTMVCVSLPRAPWWRRVLASLWLVDAAERPGLPKGRAISRV